MTPFQRVIIEKTGHDNGFEHVLTATADAITLASARHRSHAVVSVSQPQGFDTRFQSPSPLFRELQRTHGPSITSNHAFHSDTQVALALLLRRAATLSQALPNQAEQDYQAAVKQALTQLPPESRATEIERLVRQRIGQDRYRAAMLDYWGHACAVTGVNIPEVLRASHAKPWAECENDDERLNVFNGFLLTANLDALFDRFLISFDDTGALVVAPGLSQTDLLTLGIQPDMKLRWLTDDHRAYLRWHHRRFLETT